MNKNKQIYQIPHKLVSNNKAGFNLYIKKNVAELIRLNNEYVENKNVNVEVRVGDTLQESQLIITFEGGK